MVQTKTDNSFLPDKAAIRARHLPEEDVCVLDCFGGKGKVWELVATMSGRKIRRMAIDIKHDVGFSLVGDNRQFLADMDLSRFNCIDLDAYGVPADQLMILFERGYRGWVYVTFIQTMYGMMPYIVYAACGITEAMVRKIPTLFARDGWSYFKEFLSGLGVGRMYHRSKSRKHYLAFRMTNDAE